MRSLPIVAVVLAACVQQADISSGDSLSSTDANLSQPSGAPISLPGKIEAEAYALGGEGVGYHDTTAGNAGNVYRTEDVDLQASTDTGGGYNVGWIAAGEWLAYAVKTTAAGRYTFTARVASNVAGTKTLHAEVDGAALPSASFTSANGWQTFSDLPLGSTLLTAGNHTVRILFESDKLNLNYVGVTYTCAPTTCSAAGASCGSVSDGCGGMLSCGTCGAGSTCSGTNQCVCAPKTCAQVGATCGSVVDGCGGTLSCGTCTAGSTCGGANQCVCAPKTCAQVGATCGAVADGCGGSLSCGTCGAGSTCGSTNQCTASSARFPGDPGVGRMYVGGSPDPTLGGSNASDLDQWEQKMGGAKLGIERVYSGTFVAPWSAVDVAISRKMIPHMSFKSTATTDIVAGKQDAALDAIVAGFKARAPHAIWWTFFHEPEDNFTTATTSTNYRAAVRYIYQYFKAHGVTNATHVATAYMSVFTFGGGGGRDWRWWHPDWKGTSIGTMDHPDVRDFYTGADSVVDLLGLDTYMQSFGYGDPISAYDLNWFDKAMANVIARVGILNHKGFAIPEAGFRVKQTGHFSNDTGNQSTSTGWVCGTMYEPDTRSMMQNTYDSAIARGVVAFEYWNSTTTPTYYRDDRLDFCDPNGVRFSEMKKWIQDPRTAHLP